MKSKIYYFTIFIIVIFSTPLFIVYAADLKTPINEYRKIKNSVLPDSTDEVVKSGAVLDQKKRQLNKIISILVQSANNQKETFSTIGSFDQLQKDQLSQSVQLIIDNLTSQNSKIDQVNSPENLKTIADSVQNIWTSGQAELKKNQLTLLDTKITDLTTQLELNLKTTQTTSEELKIKNKDISLLQNKIDESSNMIVALKNNNLAIQQKIDSLNKDSDHEAIFQETLKLESESNKTIQSLSQTIIDASSEITRLTKDKK